MGNLVKETPYSEITATLEVLQSHGVTREHWGLIRKDPARASVVAQTMIAGYAVAMAQSVIDCDADPFVPSVFKLESHTKGGQFVFDPAKVKLHLSRNQQGSKVIVGNKLRKELANEPVLNANVLDYLLKNPHLIPEEWKKDADGNPRYIFFWGTIYRVSSGNLFVRYLCFSGGGWHWDSFWLGSGCNGDDLAALRAS